MSPFSRSYNKINALYESRCGDIQLSFNARTIKTNELCEDLFRIFHLNSRQKKRLHRTNETVTHSVHLLFSVRRIGRGKKKRPHST